jgi:hypothetical protein
MMKAIAPEEAQEDGLSFAADMRGVRQPWLIYPSPHPCGPGPRREEVLATASISRTEGYRAAMRRLEQRVSACADAYACDILPAPVAGAALTSRRNR